MLSRRRADPIREFGRCEFCGVPSDLCQHHIKSWGSGGGNEAENLTKLCFVCHGKVHLGSIRKQELIATIERTRNENHDL